MRQFVFISFFLFVSMCYSQVVNVETLRKPTDTTKWTGSASLDVSLIKNANKIFKVDNNFHVQYKNEKNLWLLLNDLNIQRLEGNSFVNKGTHHLRYNRKLSDRVRWEAFVQSQYDAISNIDFRGLIGSGPRFKILGLDNYRMYIGTLLMYEYEKADISVENRIEEAVRGSTYLSFSFHPTETLSIISTSYYQPKLDEFKDYRLSTDTVVLLRIFGQLAFKVNFTYNFDAGPVSPNIPKAQYELTNGLSYTF